MYTIKINDTRIDAQDFACKVWRALSEALEASPFTAQLSSPTRVLTRGSGEGSRMLGYAITLERARLREKKPYCGQHPGECFVGLRGERKKPKMAYLEWQDWVDLHNLVNDVLDGLQAHADVFSHPLDVKGIMWMRRGYLRRDEYNWQDHWNGGMRPVQIWDRGTTDNCFSQRCKTPDLPTLPTEEQIHATLSRYIF